LQIVATDAALDTGAHFTAHGPNGTFKAGLIAGLSLNASATLFGTNLFAPQHTKLGSFTSPLQETIFGFPLGFSVKKTATFKTPPVQSPQVNIPNIGTMTFAFPYVHTTGTNFTPGNSDTGSISATGTSNNMIKIGADVLDLITSFTGGSFNDDINDKNGNPIVDLLDLGMTFGLDLVQKFDLSSLGLTPVLVVNGIPELLSLDGTPTTIQHASQVFGGSTSFDISLGLVPTADLTNQTSIGANINAQLTAGQFFFGALGTLTLVKPTTIPVLNTTFPPIYKNTFALNGFQQTTIKQTV